MVIPALLLSALPSLAPWAETPAALARDTGAGIAISGLETQVQRDLSPALVAWLPASDLSAHLAGTWRDPVTAPPPASLSGFFGNETGDLLLRELDHEASDGNRNPCLAGAASTPARGGLRAWFDFRQIDHGSDRFLAARTARIGSPDLGTGGASRRRAWFGENLPTLSLLSGGLALERGATGADLAAGRGWIWSRTPWSAELLPWRIDHAGAALRREGSSLAVSLADLERADTLSGSRRELRAALRAEEIRPFEALALRPGGRVAATASRGAVPLRSEADSAVSVFLEHTLEFGSWSLRGRHETGSAGWESRDTAALRTGSAAASAGLSLDLGWTDRPAGALGTDSGAAGAARNRADWIDHRGRLVLSAGGERGGFRLEAASGPAWESAPAVFRLAALAAEPGASVPWVARAGEMVRAGSPWVSWPNHARLSWSPAEAFETWGRGTWEPVLERPPVVDYRPAVLSGELGLAWNAPTGFSARATVRARSSRTVRGYSETPWRVGPETTGDLWLEQRLPGRTTVSLAILDLGASPRPEHPQGALPRTRILAGLSVGLP